MWLNGNFNLYSIAHVKAFHLGKWVTVFIEKPKCVKDKNFRRQKRVITLNPVVLSDLFVVEMDLKVSKKPFALQCIRVIGEKNLFSAGFFFRYSYFSNKFFDFKTEEDVIFRELGSCCCCLEYKKSVPFVCEHSMCRVCLKDLFQNSITDVTLIPVRCCDLEIDPNLSKKVLSVVEYKKFREKYIETTTKNKMYCQNPKCGKFINLDLVETWLTTKYSCSYCKVDLCVSCKSFWHPNMSCNRFQKRREKVDVSYRLLKDLITKRKWRKCKECGHIISLATGCYHMKCFCSFEFCYLCGLEWKTCKCPQWEERNLVTVARRRRMNVNFLRNNHECRHRTWSRTYNLRWNERNCENCRYYLKHYGYRCSNCRLLACYTCRHHRLLV